MLFVGRGGTIAHKTFPASPWGNSFRVSIFGRTEAIKRYSNALSQDPLKRALLPTLAGKTLVCHCPAHEECHADALAQAYESEVMIPSEAFTPAILQRNDTGFVTEPHGFSQSADGGGVHSSGDWLARGQAPATFSKTSGTPLSTSSPKTGSTTQPKQHGRHEAAHLSSRTSTMTTSWRRQSLCCSQQDYTQIGPFTPTSPFVWGFSATCCSSCRTQTLASSTLPSQVSTRVCSNQNGSLVSGAANKPLKSTTRTGSLPKKTPTPCLAFSKRTSTPISFRSSTVTSLKPQNVGQKRWQLAASASPGRTSATHTSAWTVRYRMSTRKSRSVRGGHCFSQSGVALFRRSRSDDRRQQSTQKTPHPRRRTGASIVPASRQTLPPHSVPLWGAMQRCMVEPYGSSAHTTLPPVLFHSARWMAVRR